MATKTLTIQNNYTPNPTSLTLIAGQDTLSIVVSPTGGAKVNFSPSFPGLGSSYTVQAGTHGPFGPFPTVQTYNFCCCATSGNCTAADPKATNHSIIVGQGAGGE